MVITIRLTGKLIKTKSMQVISATVSTTLGLLAVLNSSAFAAELRSINNIQRGTTIDFENQCIINESPRCSLNGVLSPFNIESSSSGRTTVFVPWVIGNEDAPISNGAIFVGDNRIKFRATAQPWQSIGFSAVGLLLDEKQNFELRAFDINNDLLGSITTNFDPGFVIDASFPDNQKAYNNAAKFLGFASSTPIYSIEFLTSSLNTGLDNLTFTTAANTSPVPEPSITIGYAVILGFGSLILKKKIKQS